MSVQIKTTRSIGRLLTASVVLLVGLSVSAQLIFGGRLFSSSSGSKQIESRDSTTLTSLDRPPHTKALATKTAIELIRVGERVLARNEEINDEDRANWTEPDWSQWLRLSLVMPKDDGSELRMELLRSEDWVRSQLEWLVNKQDISDPIQRHRLQESSNSDTGLNGAEPNVPLSPMRPLFRDLLKTEAELQQLGLELNALLVEMDLPELAITGAAEIIDLQPAQPVQEGRGRVVTATFRHSSGDVIDLKVAGANDLDTETIGSTTNHPFWSFDRQEYIQAGALEIGERVQTYLGETKRVVSKLPRPGPVPVHNLEVHGEHVYYVGESGLLVHNSQGYSNPLTNSGRLPRKVMSEAEVAYRAAHRQARFEASAHTITLRLVEGMPPRQFMQKARALQDMGEQGLLIRRSTPRDTSITKAFRQNTIDRIWAQYGQRNREFANALIERVTRKMSPDHVHELQLMGPDASSNLRWLDRFTNTNIGMRQIWPQIRALPQGTPIRIRIE